MIRYTVADLLMEGPCSAYPRERVYDLWGGAASLSPFDIARLPIPVDDRIWALGRLLFRLSPHRACRVARLIAIDVMDLWDPPDIVVWFLGSGDEQARYPARATSKAARVSPGGARAAKAAALAAEGAHQVIVALEAAVWAFAQAISRGSSLGAAEAAWTASMERYLSWVIKAFDPFTPVGDLL